ncbi:MAG TPA: hypothetical protein VJ787_07680, partial [Thermoleophilia bacterium]|nr:hypothetical protein [Thermoleophilia bacterium]
LCVTDVSTGAVVGRAAGGSSCYKVAAFPDGERFAAAHASGDVSVWAVDGPLELARAHAHSGETLGCAVSPEGSLVASGGSDARVAIWSAADLSPVARLSGHGDAVFACAFLAAERIVTGSVDTSARIMCIERGGDGQAAPLTQPLFLGGISSVAAEPTGTVLAAGGSGRVGRVDPVRGRVLAEVGVEAGRGPSRLAPVGDASGPIALGCPNGEIHLLDRESLKIVASAPSHAGVVASCAWGPDGRELLTAGWDGSVLVSRRVFGGGLLPRASVSFAPAQVACASWLPDGRVLVGGGNGLLAIWDPATGDHDGVTVGDSTPISATVVLQDGEAVAVLADGRAVSWADACAGREAATVCRRPAALPGQEADAWGVWCAGRFGPRAIAVGATGVVTIWDVATKRVRARVPMSGAVYSVCAVESPELTLLCAGSTSGHLSVFESCGVIERGDGDSSRDDAAAR